MPIYIYACECGRSQEIVRPVKEHTKTIPCECGMEARQRLTPLHVIPDIQPYLSIVTGERIKGRAHHKTHIRDHNLVEIGSERVERKHQEMPPVVPDIKRAIEELK